MPALVSPKLAAAKASLPIFGGTAPNTQYGTNTGGDVLVNQTADGVDLNAVWTEFRDLLTIWNDERTRLTDLLAFRTTATGEAVPQNIAIPSFERATELGVPKGAHPPGDALLLGYPFYDFDLAGRFSWKFLRDADVRQVESVMNSILSADNKLVTGTILRRLFDPAATRNEFGHRVYGLYNGVDGITPPPYLGRTFPESESHYLASQSAQIDSADIEDAVRLVTRKGYGPENGAQMLILANPDEAEDIMTWRAGQPSRPGGPEARHDFIPAKTAPPYLQPENIVGEQISGSFHGIPVLGSYGESWLIQSDFIPSGYVAVAASGGPNSLANVMGFREHPNTAYRGLRMIPGSGPYPLVSSYNQRSFGVGVRQGGQRSAFRSRRNRPTPSPPTTKSRSSHARSTIRVQPRRRTHTARIRISD